MRIMIVMCFAVMKLILCRWIHFSRCIGSFSGEITYFVLYRTFNNGSNNPIRIFLFRVFFSLVCPDMLRRNQATRHCGRDSGLLNEQHHDMTDLYRALANAHPNVRTSTPKMYHSNQESKKKSLRSYASSISFRPDIAILSLIAIVRTLERCILARICRTGSNYFLFQLEVCGKALRQPKTSKNRRNTDDENHPLRTFDGECGTLPSKYSDNTYLGQFSTLLCVSSHFEW